MIKNRIKIILISVISSTVGLISFQIYWSYKSYTESERIITGYLDNALQNAIQREEQIRKNSLVDSYKTWLLDSTELVIESHWDKYYNEPYFSLADKNPREGIKPFIIRLNGFGKTSGVLSRDLRSKFAEKFIENYVRNDVNNGTVFYYTQGLGYKLENAFEKSKLDIKKLGELFSSQLHVYGILTQFKIDTTNKSYTDMPFHTHNFESGLRNRKTLIYASLKTPAVNIFMKMKWVILSSILLITITLFCFIFTLTTLLSQSKLAELKDNFVNNITHELKTPVATISIAAEAIEEFNNNPSLNSEYLSIIRYQSSKLEHMIDKILESVIVEKNFNLISKRRIDLRELIETCVNSVKPKLNQSNCKLTITLGEVPLFINGDEFLLSNVINNMIDNAIKYGSENPRIGINLHTQNEKAIITVCNDGKGIPLQYQTKIFERFFRVPTGDTHNIKGYGVGLNYVKDIIRQHKGTITLNSSPSNTIFTIYIPIFNDKA